MGKRACPSRSRRQKSLDHRHYRCELSRTAGGACAGGGEACAGRCACPRVIGGGLCTGNRTGKGTGKGTGNCTRCRTRIVACIPDGWFNGVRDGAAASGRYSCGTARRARGHPRVATFARANRAASPAVSRRAGISAPRNSIIAESAQRYANAGGRTGHGNSRTGSRAGRRHDCTGTRCRAGRYAGRCAARRGASGSGSKPRAVRKNRARCGV